MTMLSRVRSLFSSIDLRHAGNTLAPYWRRLIFLSVCFLGLALFFGSELGLAKLIVSGNYFMTITAFIAAIVIIITIAYPFWGYAIWFFLTMYLNLFGRSLPAMFSFDLIMLALLTLVLIVRILFRKESLSKLSIEEVFLVLYFVYAYIVRRPFDPSHMVAELKYFFVSPLFFYFVAKNVIREKKHIYWLMIVIIVTGFSWALMGIYEQVVEKMWLAGLLGGNIELYGGMRSTGPAGHYYVYGNMMVLTILFCLHVFKWQHSWYAKLAVVASTLTALVGLYYGFSRAPYAAFVLCMIVMLILSKRTKRIYAACMAILVLAAIIVVPILSVETKLQDRFKEGGGMGSGRIATNKTSMNMFMANYLFGVGKDKYLSYVPTYVSSMAHSSQRNSLYSLVSYWGRPHSEYFLVLAELGVIGFFLYFMTYFLFLIKFMRFRHGSSPDDVAGSDFAVVAIAFTLGVFLTMYTDEYGVHPYMYAIIFTVYAMLAKSEYFASKKSIQ